MIEIIKAGTKNEVECSNCGALLRYNFDDVKGETYGQGTYCQYIQKYIECSQCNNKITIERRR